MIRRILSTFMVVSMVFPHTLLAQTTSMPRQDLRAGQGQRAYEVRSLSDVPSDGRSLEKGDGSSAFSSSSGGFGDGSSESQIIKVHVLGEVEKPGIYNMRISDRLSDVLAKGVPKRTTQRVVEVRSQGGRARAFDLYRYYYQASLENNPYLKDNDVVFVPTSKGAVRIEGPVGRPGIYELRTERKLREIIALSGGFTSGVSYVHPLKIVRFSEGGKKFIMNVSNDERNLRDFKIQKGDIVVVPDIVNNPKKFDYSVENIPGENLFYPTSTPTVFVSGQVAMAGSFPYKSHLRVKDYVAYASPTPMARLSGVRVIRNGKKMKMNVDDRPIPGDILMVKTKMSTGAIVTAVSTAMSIVLTGLLLEATLQDRL